MPPANYRRPNPEAVPWYVPKQSQAFKRICYRLDLTDGAHSRLATEGPSEYSCKASGREFTLDHRSPVSHGGKSVSVRRPVLSHSTLGSDGARPGMPALGARSYKSGLANRRDLSRRRQRSGLAPFNRVSKGTTRVVVFHRRTLPPSHLCYASRVPSQCRTRVKLNRVFFPRRFFQARSLGGGFARR